MLVKLPVITAVEGATGMASRRRANWLAMAETAIIATMRRLNPCNQDAGEQQKLNQEKRPGQRWAAPVGRFGD